ncbi:hypothetical protein EDD16DRAFT_1585038 [Pisolithus croceorrhizus]|nr:hypothetical protein EDD16DRAFT_1585038 [Pisolithus croceorrhizus]KAI6135455.1 hypothetical protein EV401DRAFT_1900825 [Pisolithus croceorrhizus]KAI6159035.1 hypothetical protein EDD17DRAFT_1617233 [Pisolithus thermaeus]
MSDFKGSRIDCILCIPSKPLVCSSSCTCRFFNSVNCPCFSLCFLYAIIALRTHVPPIPAGKTHRCGQSTPSTMAPNAMPAVPKAIPIDHAKATSSLKPASDQIGQTKREALCRNTNWDIFCLISANFLPASRSSTSSACPVFRNSITSFSRFSTALRKSSKR